MHEKGIMCQLEGKGVPASEDSPELAALPAADRLDGAPALERALFGASSSLISEPSADGSISSLSLTHGFGGWEGGGGRSVCRV